MCVFFVKGKTLPVNKFHSPREANMLRPNENALKNQNSHFNLSLATKQHNSNLLFQCKTGQCLYNKKMTFAVLGLQMCCRRCGVPRVTSARAQCSAHIPNIIGKFVLAVTHWRKVIGCQPGGVTP